MIKYKVLYWQDIPAQIKVYGEGRPVAKKLHDRFQEHIDRVAMKKGMYGSEEYLEAWQWSAMREFEGAPEDSVEAIMDAVVADYGDCG